MSKELRDRFAGVARGRDAIVTFEPKDFVLALDYQVAFRAETSTFDVVLRRGGCFEGAYRCIERWIEAKAEQLDGIDSVPDDHVDLRGEMHYWIIEKIYDQFRLDLEAAVADRVSWLDRIRPGEGVLGEVVLEVRKQSLVGLLSHLQRTDQEVRRGILSLETIDLWKSLGLDGPTQPGNTE